MRRASYLRRRAISNPSSATSANPPAPDVEPIGLSEQAPPDDDADSAAPFVPPGTGGVLVPLACGETELPGAPAAVSPRTPP